MLSGNVSGFLGWKIYTVKYWGKYTTLRDRRSNGELGGVIASLSRVGKKNSLEGLMPWESNIGGSLFIRIFSNIFEKRGRRLIGLG